MIRQRTIQTFIPGAFNNTQTFIVNTADINNKKIVDIEWQVSGLPASIPYQGTAALPVDFASAPSAHLFLCLREHNTVGFAHYKLPLSALLRTYSPVLLATPATAGNYGAWKQFHRYTGNIDWTTSYFTTPQPLGAALWYFVNLLVTYED